MFKFLTSFRAALLLGKAQKLFDQRRFAEVLERTQKAKTLELEAHFQLHCYSLEGKARAHLEDFENALKPLHAADEIARKLLEVHPDSQHLQNIERDLAAYIDKIESAGK